MDNLKHVGRDGAAILCIAALMALAVMMAQLAATGMVYVGHMLLTAW